MSGTSATTVSSPPVTGSIRRRHRRRRSRKPLSGPTEAEQNRSLRTAIPGAAAVVEVSVARGVATVTLTPAFSEIPAADQVLAVGQIVLTLTDQRGIGRVRFVVDDASIAVPLPSGETSGDSVSRDEFIELADPPA